PSPTTSTLFPYTTLFRSQLLLGGLRQRHVEVRTGHQVVLELLGVLEILDDEEGEAEDNRQHQVDDLSLSRAHLRRPHGEHHRQRSEEHTSELQSRENLVC